MAKRRVTIEYYTINTKVLPTIQNNIRRYNDLILNWYEKGYKIITEGDKLHYFTLTQLEEFRLDNRTLFYGVISKFRNFDDLDFIDTESGNLIEYELPNNIIARAQQYEFTFSPDYHRFAFIKRGKIDSRIKKKGAPLKQIKDIIKIAFDSGLDKGTSTYVEIEQDSLVFEDIYRNKLLSLEVRVSYTNDDSTDEEHKLFVDNLLRNGKITEFFSRMKPEKNSEIDSSSELAGGLIEFGLAP